MRWNPIATSNQLTNQQLNNIHYQLPQYHHHLLLLIMILTLSSVHLSLKKFLEEEFECAICLESCTDTLVNPECNHRFCGKCIKESLHKCNHECPTCRAPIPTYRTCRRDPQFDHIVSTVLRRNDIQYVVVCIYHHDVTSCSLQSITNGDLLSCSA